METLAEQAARIAPDALLPLLRGEPGDFEEWEEIAALLAGETRLEPGTGSWDGPAVSGLQLHRLRDGSALWVVDDEFTGGRAGGAATEEAAYRLLVELATECDGWEGAPDAVFRPADIYVAPPPQVYPPGAGSIEEIRGFLASVGDRPTPDQSPTRHLSLAGYAGLCARTGHRNHAVWVDPCGYPDPDLPAPAPVATAPGDCNWWRAGLPGRTETAVRKRRQHLGLTEQMEVVDRAELVRLDAEGLSSAEVAAELGCTQRTVQQLLYLERLKERDASPS